MAADNLEIKLSVIMRRLGLGDCASSVYSCLLFRDRPASLDEICKAVKYSPTAVSTALSELEDNDLVERRKRSRKYFYTANAYFLRKFERGVEELLERELQPFRKALEKRISSVRERARARTQRLLKSVQDAEKRLLQYIRASGHSGSLKRRE